MPIKEMKERFFELASEYGVQVIPNNFKTQLANTWDEVHYFRMPIKEMKERFFELASEYGVQVIPKNFNSQYMG